MLKGKPEASKNAKSLVILNRKWFGQNPPNKIYPKKSKNIVHPSANFYICFAI
jgi:hypothetical protein